MVEFQMHIIVLTSIHFLFSGSHIENYYPLTCSGVYNSMQKEKSRQHQDSMSGKKKKRSNQSVLSPFNSNFHKQIQPLHFFTSTSRLNVIQMWTLLRSHSKCLLAFSFSSFNLGTIAKTQLTNALRQFALACTRLEFNRQMFTKHQGLNITTKVTSLAATSVLYFHSKGHFIFATAKYKHHRGHISPRQDT